MKTFATALVLGMSLGLASTAGAAGYNDRGDLYLLSAAPETQSDYGAPRFSAVHGYEDRGINWKTHIKPDMMADTLPLGCVDNQVAGYTDRQTFAPIC